MKTVGLSKRTPRAPRLRMLAVFSLLLLAGTPTLRAQSAGTAQAPGAQAPGAQAPGAQASGAQASGAQASGAQAPGAQAPGAQTAGAPTGSSGARTVSSAPVQPAAPGSPAQAAAVHGTPQPAAAAAAAPVTAPAGSTRPSDTPAIQVAVNGSTVAPGQTISVAPTPLANTSDPLVVTITNIGGATLMLDQYAPPELYGDASMMYLLDTSALGSAIDPGESTSFSVTFFPYQTGADDATLVITSNDPKTPKFAIDLSGQGLPMSDQ